jgi:hypothetical protein
LDEMHSYFSCGDFSLNLLMEVDGYLDEKKKGMLAILDAYLALDKRQKQAYSLLRRASYAHYPLSVVQDPVIMRQVLPEIEKLEAKGEGEFDKYIYFLMSHQLPQPQTDQWE